MASQPEHREAAFKTPTLSVLICTRNRPDKLKRAVDSVLSNSFTDFELIVVDQSTDEKSKELLATLGDKRLQYIPTNTIGLSISRNIAVRCSRAEIVVYTDDDCICDREWLGSIDAEFAADPTVQAVYGRVIPYGRHEGMICPCINEFHLPVGPRRAGGSRCGPGRRQQHGFQKGGFQEGRTVHRVRSEREHASTMRRIPNSATAFCGTVARLSTPRFLWCSTTSGWMACSSPIL